MTGAEKTRLLGGQLAFYGTAGTGIDWVADQAMQAMGVAPEDYPDSLLVVKQGLINTVMHASGVQNEFGTRVNLFAAPKDLVEKFTDPNTPLWEVLMGPTGSVLGRAGKGLDYIEYAV